jgi:hypothetical protein
MNNVHALEIDVRRYYTPRELERLSGVPARTIRHATDLPRLRVDAWNRVNGADFVQWLERRKVAPALPTREAEIRERARAAARADSALRPTGS